MNKIIVITIASLLTTVYGLQAAAEDSKLGAPAKTQEQYNLMHRDQVEPTDSLAIPFDESEIEDEQQINLDESKDVFNLPHQSQ